MHFDCSRLCLLSWTTWSESLAESFDWILFIVQMVFMLIKLFSRRWTISARLSMNVRILKPEVLYQVISVSQRFYKKYAIKT